MSGSMSAGLSGQPSSFYQPQPQTHQQQQNPSAYQRPQSQQQQHNPSQYQPQQQQQSPFQQPQGNLPQAYPPSQPQQRGAPQPLPPLQNQHQTGSPMQRPQASSQAQSTQPQNPSAYNPPSLQAQAQAQFQQQQQQRAQYPPYIPPTTPTGLAQERQRIALLIKLNTALLSHASSLQSQNLGGVLPSAPTTSSPDSPNKTPSPEYIANLRAIQANIAFCAMVEQKGKANRGNPTLPGPAIVEAPAGASQEIIEMYENVRKAWPGWKGVVGNRGSVVLGAGGNGDAAAQQQQQQQRAQIQQQQQQSQGQGLGKGQGQSQRNEQPTTSTSVGGELGQVATPDAGAMPSMNAPQMAVQMANQQQQQQVQQQEIAVSTQG